MAKLTKKSRARIKRGNFVFPDGTKADPGEGKFPIHDRKHAKNALSRAAGKKTKLEDKERCLVVSRVCHRFPALGLCETGTVRPGSKLASCSGLTVRGKALAPRKSKKKKK
jgi:hypothetical protein